MVSTQLKNKFKMFASCKDDAIADTVLEMAEAKVLQQLYPFNPNATTYPERYSMKVVELATILFNRMGAEGESGHTEGDISRTYIEEATLLKSITPFCGFIKREEENDEDS